MILILQIISTKNFRQIIIAIGTKEIFHTPYKITIGLLL